MPPWGLPNYVCHPFTQWALPPFVSPMTQDLKFSFIFPQIPSKNGKWGQNPAISHYYEGDFILMKVANGQNILTLFWTLRQLFLSSTAVPVVELNGGRYQSFRPSLNFWPQAIELNSRSWSLEIYFSSLNKGFFPGQWGFECNLLC